MSAIGIGLAVGSLAMDSYNSWQANKEAKKAKRKRKKYFDNELSPLLDKTTQRPDVDFGAVKDAEMGGVVSSFQDQIRGINQGTDKINSRSGFNDNSFVNKNESFALNRASESFERGSFEVDRTISTMQQQLDDTINQNRLQAKELEYSYKYG